MGLGHACILPFLLKSDDDNLGHSLQFTLVIMATLGKPAVYHGYISDEGDLGHSLQHTLSVEK